MLFKHQLRGTPQKIRLVGGHLLCSRFQKLGHHAR
jgi:hypothetical protein